MKIFLLLLSIDTKLVKQQKHHTIQQIRKLEEKVENSEFKGQPILKPIGLLT